MTTDFFETLRNNRTVPEEYKIQRPQNDAFWEQLGNGLDTDAFMDLDVDSNIDDIVTTYTREWFTALQALTNMINILSKVVEKHDIMRDGNPGLPQGLSQIFLTGEYVLDAEKMLYSNKDIFFHLEKIRKDWGSIEAYANAPEVDRNVWLQANNVTNELGTLVTLMRDNLSDLVNMI